MATYPRTEHVLSSPDNVRLLETAVRDMASAEGLVVSPMDVSHAVAAQIQSANERNITGARHLTHASILVAANEYIAMHALRDVRAATVTAASPPAAASTALETSAGTDAMLTAVRATRRREVSMRDAAVDWPALPRAHAQLQDEVRTPRTLLK